MNPNLSPNSNSGIGLDVGQKVYNCSNDKKIKRELLFIVANTWAKDTILQIDKTIEKREIELLKTINDDYFF